MSEAFPDDSLPPSDFLDYTRQVVDGIVLDMTAQREGVIAEAEHITDHPQDPDALLLREAKRTVDGALDTVPPASEPTEHPLVQIAATMRDAELGLALGKLFSMFNANREPPRVDPRTISADVTIPDMLPAPELTETEETAKHREQLVTPTVLNNRKPKSALSIDPRLIPPESQRYAA